MRASWFANVDLANYNDTPSGARYVADIWMSGWLSKYVCIRLLSFLTWRLRVPRYIVPFDSGHISLPIAEAKTLDGTMARDGISRFVANADTVEYFLPYFHADKLLSYKEDPAGKSIGGEKASYAGYFWY